MFRGCSQRFKCFSFDPVASFLPRSSCWESQSLFQASQSLSLTSSSCSVPVFILQVTACRLSVQSRKLYSIFKLCEAKDPLLLLVGEQLSGYLTLFVRGRTQSQQNESLRVSETVPGNWYYPVHIRQPSLEEIYPQKRSVSSTSR